jgi:hypothetical protein
MEDPTYRTDLMEWEDIRIYFDLELGSFAEVFFKGLEIDHDSARDEFDQNYSHLKQEHPEGVTRYVLHRAFKQIIGMQWMKSRGFNLDEHSDAYLMKMVHVGQDLYDAIPKGLHDRYLRINRDPLLFILLKEKYESLTTDEKLKRAKEMDFVDNKYMEELLPVLVQEISSNPQFEGFPCSYDKVRAAYQRNHDVLANPNHYGRTYSFTLEALTKIIIAEWAHWREFTGDEYYAAYAMKAKTIDFNLDPHGHPGLTPHVENMKRNPEAFKAAQDKYKR